MHEFDASSEYTAPLDRCLLILFDRQQGQTLSIETMTASPMICKIEVDLELRIRPELRIRLELRIHPELRIRQDVGLQI